MRKLLNYVSCAVITFIAGIGVHSLNPGVKHSSVGVSRIDRTPVAEPVSATRVDGSPGQATKTMQFSDLLTSEESLHLNGYLIKKTIKTFTFEDLNGYRSDQSYIEISKGATPLRSFDAGAYHPSGNGADFGLFPFLGTQSQQVAISQDISRGGAQWIVDLSSKPRVVFDGPAWGVGRESYDCVVEDIEGDGIFEIRLPITDFYALMDKLAVAGVPLPQITFQYDPVKKQYLPANHILSQPNAANVPEVPVGSNDLRFRSIVIGHTLELIYQGKRDQAWQYFDAAYNLDDKKEIERRVKRILLDQPVYKFIYKQLRNE